MKKYKKFDNKSYFLHFYRHFYSKGYFSNSLKVQAKIGRCSENFLLGSVPLRPRADWRNICICQNLVKKNEGLSENLKKMRK